MVRVDYDKEVFCGRCNRRENKETVKRSKTGRPLCSKCGNFMRTKSWRKKSKPQKIKGIHFLLVAILAIIIFILFLSFTWEALFFSPIFAIVIWVNIWIFIDENRKKKKR